MKGINLRQVLAFESAEDGRRAKEMEYTFYGKLADPSQLEERSYEKEVQEQWLVPIETSVNGKLRIRKVNDGERYLICTKIQRDGQFGQEEVEAEITADLYNHLREMGVGGFKKTRYFFKIEGRFDMIWEVDVFMTETGADSLWVKLDLEVPKPDTEVPPFPVELIEAVVGQGDDMTDEERSVVSELWEREWAEIDPTR